MGSGFEVGSGVWFAIGFLQDANALCKTPGRFHGDVPLGLCVCRDRRDEPLGRGARCELPPPPDPHPRGFSPPPLFQLPPVPVSQQPLTIIQQLPMATAPPTGPPHLWGGV